MKVRNGFVSNSSSSSFILRGIRIDEVELCNLLGIEIPEEIKDCKTLYGELWEEFTNKLKPFDLNFETTKNYFDGDPTGEVVIGESLGDLDDGEITEISDYEKDVELIEKLKSIGVVDPKPTTFVQMVSNDNY